MNPASGSYLWRSTSACINCRLFLHILLFKCSYYIISLRFWEEPHVRPPRSSSRRHAPAQPDSPAQKETAPSRFVCSLCFFLFMIFVVAIFPPTYFNLCVCRRSMKAAPLPAPLSPIQQRNTYPQAAHSSPHPLLFLFPFYVSSSPAHTISTTPTTLLCHSGVLRAARPTVQGAWGEGWACVG